MTIETSIRNSMWWKRAAEMLDRHYDSGHELRVSDHLEAVLKNAHCLVTPESFGEYYVQLCAALEVQGLDPAELGRQLGIVALLHDIGKPGENKAEQIDHPLSGKKVRKRHPVVGVMAALELLPEELPGLVKASRDAEQTGEAT